MFRATPLLLLLAAAIAIASADPPQASPSGCTEPATVFNFNVSSFSGVWFDQVHTKRSSGFALKCDQVKFGVVNSTSSKFTSVSYSSATKGVIAVGGSATMYPDGKLDVVIPTINRRGKVIVLNTDYTSFAVLWACSSNNSTQNVRSLVLTRDKHPNSKLVQAAVEVLVKNNVPKSSLSFSETQHKCQQYEFDSAGEMKGNLGYLTSMGSLLTPVTG